MFLYDSKNVGSFRSDSNMAATRYSTFWL